MTITTNEIKAVNIFIWFFHQISLDQVTHWHLRAIKIVSTTCRFLNH